jgi:rod shape-determining protein MreD
MRWLRFSLLLIVFSLAAVRFPAALTASGWTPLWLFLPALLFGFVSTPPTAALGAWCFGAMAGLLSIEPFGVSAFLYALVAFLTARVRGHVFSEHPLTQVFGAFLLALFVLFVELTRIEFSDPALAFWSAVPTALLVAAMTGLVFPLLFKLSKRYGLLAGFTEEQSRVRA